MSILDKISVVMVGDPSENLEEKRKKLEESLKTEIKKRYGIPDEPQNQNTQ